MAAVIPFLPLARRCCAALLVAVTIVAAALAGAAPSADAATPKRIVAITPFTANILAQLGVRPVAVGAPAAGQQGLTSALNGVPRLTLSHPNGPNLEQLVALRPDTLFSSPVWRAGTPRISRLGIKVYDSLDPQRLGTVPIGIQKISQIVGKTSQGNALAARVQAQYRAAQAGITKHPRVLLVMGLAQYTLAILGNSWGGDIITAAGGTLVTKDIKPIAGSGEDAVVGNLSNEAVVRMNPDVIIVVPHGNSSDVPTIAKYYRKFAPWRTTKAARTGRIYVPTDDLLLQATSDPAALIRTVRTQYLHN
jgi:iron complex transport system substrate-binding protein